MKQLFLLLLMATTFSQAQNFRGLDKSPMDQAKYPISNRITEKVAVITYSRPQLNGRSLEALVPLGKVWRTGANEAAELRVFTDIQIGETILVAGTYTFFTILEKNTATFIVNSATNLWGAYAYNSNNDVLRITVPRTESETVLEAFSIAFSKDEGQPKIHMGWANTRFEVPFMVL